MEVHYSQQARMYTLGTFFAITGCIALVDAWETRLRRAVFLWAGLRLMMLFTLPLTVLLLVADGLMTFRNRCLQQLQPLFYGCLTAVVLCWLPLAVRLPSLARSDYDTWRCDLPNPDVSDLLTLVINFTCNAFAIQECKGPPIDSWYSYAYILLIPCLLILAILSTVRFPRLLSCMVWLCLPLSIVFCESQIAPPLFVTRYVMYTAPFAFILLAADGPNSGGVAARWASRRPAVYALTMVSSLCHYYTHSIHEDWREIADYIRTNEQPGDRIAIWNYHSSYLMHYYYHGRNPICDFDVRPDAAQGASAGLRIMLTDCGPTGRIWLISQDVDQFWYRFFDFYTHYKETVRRQFTVLKQARLARTDIFLVSPRPTNAVQCRFTKFETIGK